MAQVIHCIRELTQSENSSIARILQVVSVEPALTEELLRIANSAALNPRNLRVTSLRTAVLRVGLDLLGDILIAYSVKQLSAIPNAAELVNPAPP